MNDQYPTLHSTLIELERELKELQLWHNERPSDSALASTEPFCIDTLSFPQWLQFVFYERMMFLVKTQAPLPNKCGIAPMAQEHFKHTHRDARPLLLILETIDEVLAQ